MSLAGWNAPAKPPPRAPPYVALVTLVSTAVVGVLFGGLAVILAVPFTSAVATLIDVLVLGHEPPTEQPRRRSGSVAPDDAFQLAAANRPQRPVFVNPKSGGGKATRAGLAERARERGIDVIVLRRDDNLAALVDEAVAGGADALGVAGGDGSLAVVATAAVPRASVRLRPRRHP